MSAYKAVFSSSRVTNLMKFRKEESDVFDSMSDTGVGEIVGQNAVGIIKGQ